MQIMLSDYTLTNEILSELRELPIAPHMNTVIFMTCRFVPELTYEDLVSFLPACCSNIQVFLPRALTVQNILGICRGARVRGEGGEKLSLYVNIRRVTDLTYEDREMVETCIEEERLGRWVEGVKWDY